LARSLEEGWIETYSRLPRAFAEPLSKVMQAGAATIRALQARLEAAEKNRDETYYSLHARLETAETERDIAVVHEIELRALFQDREARIADLEKPVTDEEVTAAITELEGWAERRAKSDPRTERGDFIEWEAARLLHRLSRQSKSNALLGKCEEALNQMIDACERREEHGAGTDGEVDGCEVCIAIINARAILSQIEQSGDDAEYIVAPPHQWVPSTLCHGEVMCKVCTVTNREASVLGELDWCRAALEVKEGKT
jgi:hypothetical protein